jgi:hypothetical protein
MSQAKRRLQAPGQEKWDEFSSDCKVRRRRAASARRELSRGELLFYIGATHATALRQAIPTH